jgi:hypothetical protein
MLPYQTARRLSAVSRRVAENLQLKFIRRGGCNSIMRGPLYIAASNHLAHLIR